jgi:hypothetical protein
MNEEVIKEAHRLFSQKGGRARSEKKKESSKRNGFQKGWRKALEYQNKLKEL